MCSNHNAKWLSNVRWLLYNKVRQYLLAVLQTIFKDCEGQGQYNVEVGTMLH